MKNRDGQIAIFVIVGILLVAAFTFIFFINRKPTVMRGQDFDNPESYIDNCIKEAAENKLDEMFVRGGFLDNGNTIVYENVPVTYTCNTINPYEKCINQYPRFIISVQNELNRLLQNEAEQCFSLLENQLQSKGYEISLGDVQVISEFSPGITEITINTDFEITRDGFTRDFDSFQIFLKYPAYDLTEVVSLINSQEAEFCYFAHDAYIINHPEFDIYKWVTSDSTKIYTVEDMETGKIIRIAIRGCAIRLE